MWIITTFNLTIILGAKSDFKNCPVFTDLLIQAGKMFIALGTVWLADIRVE